jgi:ribonuclease-3
VFRNKDLIQEALTHSSFAKRQVPPVRDNERLEFFGDAVLKLIISEYLYAKYPHESEGELTKKRARMVADKLLATLAQALNIGEFLRLSPGEKKGGGAERASNLANAMEAILGALYMDQGYEAAKTFFISVLQDVGYNDDSALHDNKTKLQEWAQKQGLALPKYQVLKSEGPDHDKIFYVEVVVNRNGTPMVSVGYGKSKKEAEQHAAKKLLSSLKSQ